MRIDQRRPFGLIPWATQRTNLREPRGPRRWDRPPRVTDVAVHTPRALVYGRSIAPQTGGGGIVHVIDRAVTCRVDGARWLFGRWLCGGHSIYAEVVTDPAGYTDWCRRCRLLSADRMGEP